MANNEVKFADGNVSGVFGYHKDVESAKVRGWEHHTTALGGSVDIRLGQVQGVQSFDHNTVSIDEPLRLGRFLGVWLRTPPFFNPVITKYFVYFFQDKILEVSGLNDNEVSTMSRTMGANGREEVYAGNYKESNGKFTIKIPEVKGSPVRKIMKYYVSGISDPVTGTGHFHGNKELRFCKINYGGDFLYALLGPTMRPDDIEFACLWLNAFPVTDYIGHLNSGAIGEPGDAGLSFDVAFNGTYVQNDEINMLAMYCVEAYGLYKDTAEDVVLPSYIYKYFLKDGGVNTAEAEKYLGSFIGGNLKNRLTKGSEVEGAIGEDVTTISETREELDTATPEVALTIDGTEDTSGVTFDTGA